ncbi:MAG: helix-hairpin-helix domain-containing protein [Firmicutes bacterium]|nr:helix-hairpin-helix domain-containing protein [Bacillota bacterium]
MDRDRLKILAVFVSVFLILCGYFYFTQRNTMINKVAKIQTQSSSSDISQNHPELESAEKIIDGLKVMTSTVHVAGAVKNPGVYNLPSSSRVIDAIEKAGGATENADLDQINLADYVSDGQKIEVPKLKSGDTSLNYKLITDELDKIGANKIDSTNEKSSSKSDLVNINTADSSELQSLPGIGTTIANSIIEYRKENGNFETIEDLKNVSRIGDKTFDKLKDLITVD